jgi:hypothetical protein
LLLGLKGQLWVTSSDRLPQTTSGDKQVHAVAMASSGSGGAHGIGSVASPPALAAYAALLLCEWTFSPLSECLEDPRPSESTRPPPITHARATSVFVEYLLS